MDRRKFIGATAAISTAAIGGLAMSRNRDGGTVAETGYGDGTPLLVPKAAGLPITGTFLDEISHDIPHQNWGEKEWDRDFQYMKNGVHK